MTAKAPHPRLPLGRWLRAALLLPLLMAAGVAQAHAVVTAAEPGDGALLASPPAEVVLRFNEPVALIHAQVLDPDGRDALAPGAAQSREDGLHLSLPDRLGPGTYTVSYHVTSLDGHPVEGSLVFSLGHVSGGAHPVADGAQAWRWTFVAARLALYLGLVGAVGGVAYARLVRPTGPARDSVWQLAGASAALGLCAVVPTLGLHGGRLFGGPARQLLDPATWEAGALSAFGCTVLCAAAGLALIGAAARARRRPGAGILALMGAGLALGGFVLSGHAVTAGPRWITSPLLLLHVGAAAFWAGSLLPLVRALTRPAREAALLLQTFSRRAVPAVALLVLAGLGLAWLQVRHLAPLPATEYGRFLLVKLGLVGGLLGLAALNRLRLTPALIRGEARSPRRLRRSIQAEAALVAAILAVTAALGTTVPPRALMAAEALAAPGPHDPAVDARHLHVMGTGFHGDISFAPGGLGANTVAIRLRDLDGRPLQVPQVALRLSNPSRGIAPLERPARPDGPGVWRIDGVTLGVPGAWDLELEVLVSDFDRQTARARLDL
ncbi:copper resistance CopC/CopD family protein [Rubellimicrobium arenae]|uniref:copper resistance CopC/CopD family protein n=1 Tax=Rubellimicrobium arenae TaxID=2817372 RepID=UPI001B3025C3|nr:FixH family protein [Rubellimicrobium arenae]